MRLCVTLQQDDTKLLAVQIDLEPKSIFFYVPLPTCVITSTEQQ